MHGKTAKATRGSTSQYYVAAELSRRGWIAAVTLGNSPHTDILCSNASGTLAVQIQVKTFQLVPDKGSKCPVGLKAEIDYGRRFFWVLVGIPADLEGRPIYYVIPSAKMKKHVVAAHQIFVKKTGKTNRFRAVRTPPDKGRDGWSIKRFAERWDLIEDKLKGIVGAKGAGAGGKGTGGDKTPGGGIG